MTYRSEDASRAAQRVYGNLRKRRACGLAARDPQRAALFYKTLVIRCLNTDLGKAVEMPLDQCGEIGLGAGLDEAK